MCSANKDTLQETWRKFQEKVALQSIAFVGVNIYTQDLILSQFDFHTL